MDSARRHYVAAAASGILLGISFPPLPVGGLAFGALVPLLWVLTASPAAGQWLRVCYVFGFCFHGAANWWVSSWQSEADPYLLVAGLLLWLGHPVFFLLPLWASWWIARRVSLSWGLMSFPFVWTAFEWLHSLGDIGYPWLSLGYTQALNLHWIQVVDLAGVWGASFLVVWANVALVEVLRLWLQAQARGGSVRQWLRRWDVRGWMGVGLAVVVLPMLYGSLRLEQLRMHPTERTLRAILVQPNVNPWAKWERTAVEQIYLQQRLADTLLERDRADLVVWNETAIPLPLTLPEYRWVWESVQAWVRYRQVALLSGFAELRVYRTEEAPRFARPLPWDSTRRYEAYNAAFLLGSTGELLGIYRKIRLTPFAERFPYAELFGELTRLFEWGVGISAWAKGGEQRLLLLPRRLGDTVALGVAICIESIFPDFMRAYARQGADVLVVISNDAWFDHTPGPMQHFAIARVRAIELRRPLLRCANSGVTAAVLPTGEVLAQLPQYEAAALPVVLPLRREQSLYERFGEGLPHAATGVSLLLLGVALWRKSVPLEKP